MRLSNLWMVLLTTLLLTACANTEEQEHKEQAAQANFKLGIGYTQSGRFQVAAEKLLKALQFRQDFPEAHNALAVVYEEMREYNSAERHFKQAIALKPDYTLAKLNYARLLCTRKPLRLEQGEAEYRRIAENAAHAGSTASDAYAGLAACALQRKDSALAETYLRQALKSNPDNAIALFKMAVLSQQQNKTLQSRAFLQRFHANSPPTPGSLWIGILIERSSDGDRMLYARYVKLLTSQYPDSNEARRLQQLE